MILSPDNSFVVEHSVTNLLLNNIYVNDATVTLDISNVDGTPITGTSFPQQIPYVTGSNGVYRKSFTPITNLILGQIYIVTLVTTDSSGMVSTCSTDVRATKRKC